MTATATPAATPWFNPDQKPFGFSGNLRLPDDPESFTKLLDRAALAGATHYRITMHWRSYEAESSPAAPVPRSYGVPLGQPTGNPETDRVDAEYLAMVERGITPVMVVHSAPNWASTFYRCLDPVFRLLSFSSCPDGWQKSRQLFPHRDRWEAHYRFVRAAAQRYPEAILEGPNEPDFHQHFQPQYHPNVGEVAHAQCNFYAAVKAADPDRTVLSSSLYLIPYAHEYHRAIAGLRCFDHMAFHPIAGADVRAGPSAGIRSRLLEYKQMSQQYFDGSPVWVTETGMSTTQTYNAEQDQLGEPLVARAMQRWVPEMLNNPDIAGMLVYTLVDGQDLQPRGSIGYGLGQLNPDLTVKQPGPGVIPRFCWFVLSAQNQYPGCEGMSLPDLGTPAPPTFWREPTLFVPREQPIGKTAGVVFLEEGVPAPDVTVLWFSCNALGLQCQRIMSGSTAYKIREAERYRRLKVVIHMENEHGARDFTTPLSDMIL